MPGRSSTATSSPAPPGACPKTSGAPSAARRRRPTEHRGAQRRAAMRRDAVASPNSCGIAHHRRTRRHVPRDHTARSDDGIVADTHPRQDEGAAADPDVAPDLDRAAELEPGRPLREAARMIGGQDLHARAALRLVTDGYRDDVQDHAVEVEEDMRAEADVDAGGAVERRADDASLADGGRSAERRVGKEWCRRW